MPFESCNTGPDLLVHYSEPIVFTNVLIDNPDKNSIWPTGSGKTGNTTDFSVLKKDGYSSIMQ